MLPVYIVVVVHQLLGKLPEVGDDHTHPPVGLGRCPRTPNSACGLMGTILAITFQVASMLS
jgi:hypothetical protein